MSKHNYRIEQIDRETALSMVQKYHYSNTLPKLNKIFVGFYLGEELVGVVTLGWGTRPRHTIQKLFPGLDTKDYYEIGRMCMTEDMQRNSESQMLAQLVRWIKTNLPEIKVLFTWADGMLGKVGYVYQAANFLYAGYSKTDFYMKDGVKLHPRQMKSILSPDDKRKTVRPTLEQLNSFSIDHYEGKQFRYVYFVCEKKEAAKLQKECLVELSRNYPKEAALSWRKKSELGKWLDSPIPNYISDTTTKKMKLSNITKEEIL